MERSNSVTGVAVVNSTGQRSRSKFLSLVKPKRGSFILSCFLNVQMLIALGGSSGMMLVKMSKINLRILSQVKARLDLPPIATYFC